MSAPGFTLVLVHWNRAEACAETVERFLEQGVPLQVLVVDNGSDRSARERLRAALAGRPAALIECGRNLGFGPGANIGLRRWLDDPVGTEWALVAPHDAAPHPGCLEALAAALDANPAAGLACADVGDGQTPVIDPYFGGITRPASRRTGWEEADYPHGTLLAARRACLREIGLFDERYFSYCEEADLGRRARLHGWAVGIVRDARVTNTHLGSSVPLVDYLQQRNTLLLVSEMSGRYHALVRICITLWQVLDGLLRPARRPPVFDARARLLGVRDFLRGRFGPPPPGIRGRRPRGRRDRRRGSPSPSAWRSGRRPAA